MDSRAVNKEIQSQVRPMMRARGFTAFTARNAWRYSSERIDVVNFRSFNSYQASIIGCTTHSIAVNLGSHVPEREWSAAWPDVPELLKTQEYECWFRRALTKSVQQAQVARRDIWYVNPDGTNLQSVIDDVRAALEAQAWPWFDRYSDNERVTRILKATNELEDDGTYGVGANPSPQRNVVIATLEARVDWRKSRC